MKEKHFHTNITPIWLTTCQQKNLQCHFHLTNPPEFAKQWLEQMLLSFFRNKTRKTYILPSNFHMASKAKKEISAKNCRQIAGNCHFNSPTLQYTQALNKLTHTHTATLMPKYCHRIECPKTKSFFSSHPLLRKHATKPSGRAGGNSKRPTPSNQMTLLQIGVYNNLNSLGWWPASREPKHHTNTHTQNAFSRNECQPTSTWSERMSVCITSTLYHCYCGVLPNRVIHSPSFLPHPMNVNDM